MSGSLRTFAGMSRAAFVEEVRRAVDDGLLPVDTHTALVRPFADRGDQRVHWLLASLAFILVEASPPPPVPVPTRPHSL